MRNNKYVHTIKAIIYTTMAVVLAACSSTKSVPDGDQLYTGLKPINYRNYEKCDHFYDT